jgi:hypothetical protein
MTAFGITAAQVHMQIGRRAAIVFLMLGASALMSACGVTKVSNDRAFDAKSKDAIVIVAARPDINPALAADINSNNSHGLYYSLIWRKYDQDTDIATKMPGPDFFKVLIGLNNSGINSCRLIDEWTYCIQAVEPTYYVMASSIVNQETSAGLHRGYFTLQRTSLGVGKNFLGGLEINDDVPVSESGAQRLKLEAGKIYYLGEYQLSKYAQVMSRDSHPERARHLLSDFPNMKGDMVEPEYIGSYRLQLRTGFCPLQKHISSTEFATGNVC